MLVAVHEALQEITNWSDADSSSIILQLSCATEQPTFLVYPHVFGGNWLMSRRRRRRCVQTRVGRNRKRSARLFRQWQSRWEWPPSEPIEKALMSAEYSGEPVTNGLENMDCGAVQARPVQLQRKDTRAD
uniref:Uncharacterized protein n=1 Tax=Timema cristinae TaxID=61476 RepID=A0A7R9CD41_TIMCR|nr:unnamed protein product [Timema cristinae]